MHVLFPGNVANNANIVQVYLICTSLLHSILIFNLHNGQMTPVNLAPVTLAPVSATPLDYIKYTYLIHIHYRSHC